MWNIGNISIPNRYVAAPLAGISNPVYRRLCRQFGAGLVVSEMISDKALHYDNARTKDMCRTIEDEHPVSLQLFGSEEDTMAEAAEFLTTHTDCDIIDINMGCPVTKVVKAHSGSYLLKDPIHAQKIAKAVITHTNKPVTVKMRAGWDHTQISCAEIAKRLEEVGVSAITIHGRTKTQMYEGQVQLEYIKMVNDAVSIPVIGNGDIQTIEDAKRMFEVTGCDAVMIGRGLLGKPFFLQELLAYENQEDYQEPTIQERLKLCLTYAKDLCAYEGEQTAILMMRSMGPWFLKGMPGSAMYRSQLANASTLEQFKTILQDYERTL